MSGERLFALTYFINAFLVLTTLVSLEIFLRNLREKEPDVHRALGSPLIFGNNTGINMIRAVVFLFRRKYAGLSDNHLKVMGGFSLGVMVFSLVIGGATTLYFLVFPGEPKF